MLLGFEIVVKPFEFCNQDKGSVMKWNTYRRSYIDASLIASKLSIGMACILPLPCLANWKVVHYLLGKSYLASTYTGEGSLMFGEGFFMMLGAWLTCLVAFAFIFNHKYKWGFHGHWTIDQDAIADGEHRKEKLSKAERAAKKKAALMAEIDEMLEPVYPMGVRRRKILLVHCIPGLKLLWPADSCLKHLTFFTETFDTKVVGGMGVLSIGMLCLWLLFDPIYESGWCRGAGTILICTTCWNGFQLFAHSIAWSFAETRARGKEVDKLAEMCKGYTVHTLKTPETLSGEKYPRTLYFNIGEDLTSMIVSRREDDHEVDRWKWDDVNDIRIVPTKTKNNDCLEYTIQVWALLLLGCSQTRTNLLVSQNVGKFMFRTNLQEGHMLGSAFLQFQKQ
jgi:hypothetical protein